MLREVTVNAAMLRLRCCDVNEFATLTAGGGPKNGSCGSGARTGAGTNPLENKLDALSSAYPCLAWASQAQVA